MNSKKVIAGLLCLSGGLFFSHMATAQKSGYAVTKKLKIGGEGGWDYLSVCGNKLYVSHATQVNIIDKTSGDSIGVIPGTTGVHGIAFDVALNKGYTSNGKLNNVSVFNLSTGKVLSQIATGQKPDAIIYEVFTKNIITCNGKSNDLTLIDPATDKVVATIPVGGKPETAVSDNKGSLFVNIEDKNEIVVVDLAKRTVTKHFSLAPDEGPTGLAFDVKNNRLFAATDKSLVVVDAVTGKVVKRVAIGEGCDGAAYDAERKMIFTSNGEGTLSIIQQGANDQYTLIENLPTKKSAKTIAIDQQSHAVYLPAAELDHSDPNAKKPAAVPGSFEVLVVSKQ